MLNPEYRKSTLRDDKGKILLPRTTSSMVSEEPDRMFVDNVEKKTLNILTEEAPILKELSSLVGQIRLMADNIDGLVSVLEGQETLKELGENGAQILALVPLIPQLQELLAAKVKIRSLTSSILYSVIVDDSTDPSNPVLKLVAVEEQPTQDINMDEEILPPVPGEPVEPPASTETVVEEETTIIPDPPAKEETQEPIDNTDSTGNL